MTVVAQCSVGPRDRAHATCLLCGRIPARGDSGSWFVLRSAVPVAHHTAARLEEIRRRNELALAIRLGADPSSPGLAARTFFLLATLETANRCRQTNARHKVCVPCRCATACGNMVSCFDWWKLGVEIYCAHKRRTGSKKENLAADAIASEAQPRSGNQTYMQVEASVLQTDMPKAEACQTSRYAAVQHHMYCQTALQGNLTEGPARPG